MSYRPMPQSRMSNRPTQIVGHRGVSGLAPENTLAAFELALMMALDGFELDVQRSSDGELVVFHDSELNRTTDGNGWLADKTLDELQNLDAGSWFDDRYQGERIPTLAQLFDIMHGNDLLMFIELKDPARYPNIERELAELIYHHNYLDRVQVRSFDHSSLKRLHTLAPDIPISELWADRLPKANETFAATIDAFYLLYTQETIAEIHSRGQQATAWTVNDVDIAKQLIEWGIDALASDYPNHLTRLFRQTKPW